LQRTSLHKECYSYPMTEKELLRLQIRSYDFYADLIERAVGGTGDERPKWNSERAQQYRKLADDARRRLEEIEAQEAQQSSKAS
jgi:hypothetical protein